MTARITGEDSRGGPPRTLRDLQRDIAALQATYQRACEIIAEMHAAAVGEVRQPIRGLVQDILDARAAWGEEIDHMASVVATVSFERSQMAKRLAEDQAFFVQRIDQLTTVLREAGIEDPGVPEQERKTLVPPEFFDQLTAEDGGC